MGLENKGGARVNSWGNDPEYKELVEAYGITIVRRMESLGYDLHEAYLEMKQEEKIDGEEAGILELL